METKNEITEKCPWGDRAFGAILVSLVSFIALILFQWTIWDIRLFGGISILLGILYLIFAKSPGSYKTWLTEILDTIC